MKYNVHFNVALLVHYQECFILCGFCFICKSWMLNVVSVCMRVTGCGVYPVLSVLSPPLQASLKFLTNTSRFKKLFHQLFYVVQLLGLQKRFEETEVQAESLFQRSDGHFGQRTLGAGTHLIQTHWYRFHQLTKSRQSIGFNHPCLQLRNKRMYKHSVWIS